MSGKVDIHLEIDSSCQKPEVIIRSDRQTELTDRIISALERCLGNEYPPVMAYRKDTLVLIAQKEIIRVHTENKRLILCTESGRYEARQPLKELVEKLDRDCFFRISRFEIMNLRKVAGFDFSSAGTIRVIFTDGSDTWVARRYVQVVQQTLKEQTKGKEAQA